MSPDVENRNTKFFMMIDSSYKTRSVGVSSRYNVNDDICDIDLAFVFGDIKCREKNRWIPPDHDLLPYSSKH
jgi:hypothetical protein